MLLSSLCGTFLCGTFSPEEGAVCVMHQMFPVNMFGNCLHNSPAVKHSGAPVGRYQHFKHYFNIFRADNQFLIVVLFSVSS